MSALSIIRVVDIVSNISLRQKLLLLCLFGFFIRLYVVVNAVTISNDSVTFLRMAESFSAGDYGAIFNIIRPPLYPLLTSFTSVFFGDMEISARVVSLVFGTLVIPVSYGIGRLVYNEKVGLVTALFVMIHPYMVRFSGEALTEGLYYFLTACVVYFGFRAVFLKKPWLMLAAGVFTAFGYLAKPGAIGFLLVISFIAIVYDFKNFKNDWQRRILSLFFAWAVFIALGLPYLYYLYTRTGGLAITGKFVATIFSSKEIITVGGNLSAFLSHFPESFSWVFVPFLIYGLALRFKKGLNVREYSVFAILLAWWVVFYASTPSRKYMVQLMPVAMIFPAVGYVYLWEYLKDRYGRKGIVIAVWLLVIVCVVQMNHGMVALHKHRYLERQAALWMKDNMGEGISVTSRKNIFAYYANAEHVRMREMDLIRNVAGFALKDGAEYLVGYPYKLDKRMRDFGLEKDKYLKEVKTFKSQDGRLFVIYKIIPGPPVE